MPMKCMVYNCSKASVAKGLCDTHRKRVERHGDVDAERAPDWGKRENTPRTELGPACVGTIGSLCQRNGLLISGRL